MPAKYEGPFPTNFSTDSLGSKAFRDYQQERFITKEGLWSRS